MKIRQPAQRNHFAPGVVVLVLFSSAWLVEGARNPAAAAQETVSGARARAFAAGGLQAGAAVTGSITKTVADNRGTPVSLYQLVSFAKVIVVATPIRNRGFLSPDGATVQTFFSMEVTESLKGDTQLEQLELVIPGGRVSFDDGTWAQVNVEDFNRPLGDRRYLLFLREAVPTHTSEKGRRATPVPIFEPAFGALGIYDISDPRALAKPAGREGSSFGRWLRREGMTGATLLETAGMMARSARHD